MTGLHRTPRRKKYFDGIIQLRNSILLVSVVTLVLPLYGQATKGNDRVVVAVYTRSRITIDGELTEPAWRTAQPAKDFIQRDPSEGEPATEPTEVRVLYDDKNIYIGAECHHKTSASIVVRDITRDFSTQGQDYFGVLMDTFNDDRSGFLVATTPKGGQLDVQVLNENRDVNVNWDGVWYVNSRVHEEGWTAELAIPFKTLRFSKEEVQVWGIQFFRKIRRRNEMTYWTSVPRRYSDDYQVSLAGEMIGLERVEPGRNLKVKPFVLAGLDKFAAQGKGIGGDLDGGLDVKYGLTPGLIADMTLNTDFSQVEADVQQVNLTRFPLFFPEKREFFLENAGIFQFGETYRLGPPRKQELIPFFSRKIGLSDQGLPIPILAGARLTGRQGPYYLGFMNIQTRSEGSVPANNFTVARVRRDFLANSDMGVLFINRRSGQFRDYNRLVGADLNFRFFQDLKANVFLAKTQTPGLSGKDGAGKVEMQWRGDRFRFIGSYLDIQENFNPEVGFVRRPGRKILHNEIGIRGRLRQGTRLGSFLRDVGGLVLSDYVILPGGVTETKFLRPQLRLEFQDGGGVESQYTLNFERLSEPFTIGRSASDRITVPIGDYKFNEFMIWYFSDPSKAISVKAIYRRGDFFNGKKKTITLGGTFQPGYRFSISVDYERNDINLGEDSLKTDLARLTLNYSFNPKMFLNALIQYNSDANRISANVRFRLIHHSLSDLFLVYNEQRDVQQERSDRSITLKYTHLLNF